MNYQPPRLGFDRFMALEWVNTALELRLANQNTDDAFHELQAWLSKEIPGKETARKTATQVRRLWLVDNDSAHQLRQQALGSGLADDPMYRTFLHFGLALNVFPLFWDVCQTTGRLLNLRGTCQRKEIHRRMLEKYVNPRSTKVATDRVFQTLVAWDLLIEQNGELSAKANFVDNNQLTQWLIITLLIAQTIDRIPLVDLSNAPELLGIRFGNVRSAIREVPFLRIERILNLEMVTYERRDNLD